MIFVVPEAICVGNCTSVEEAKVVPQNNPVVVVALSHISNINPFKSTPVGFTMVDVPEIVVVAIPPSPILNTSKVVEAFVA